MKFIPFPTTCFTSEFTYNEFQPMWDFSPCYSSVSIINIIDEIRNKEAIAFVIDQNNKVIYKLDNTNIDEFKEKYLVLI